MSGGWLALGELAGMLGGLAAVWYFLGRGDRGGGEADAAPDDAGGGDGGGD